MRARVTERRSRRDERGATLVLVAVFAVVAVVMVAAVVDLGGLREQRKEVTLSTDAAALAAAGLADTEDDDLLALAPETLVDCASVGISPFAPNPDSFTDVRAVVEDYLTRNGGSGYVDCKVARTSFREGYVVVSAEEIVDFAFAPAFGQDTGSVAGASVAAIEVNSGGGLRPVGICGLSETMAGVSGYPEISLEALYAGASGGYELDGQGYVVLEGTSTRSPFTARFAIDKVKGGECSPPAGGGSGNFGKLDFGGFNSTSCTEIGHFCKDYKDGYFGTLANPTKGDTGNNWGNAQTEESTVNLETDVGQFWAPVFQGLSGTGGNANFELLYFVELEMVNHCFSGSCKFDGATWFDFRVARMLPFSPAGPPVTDDANVKAQRLCAVTADAPAIDAGCPQGVVTTSTAPPASSTTTTTTTTTTTPTTSAPPCQLTEVSANRTSVTTNGAGKLNDEVTLTIAVQSAANCPGLQAYLQIGPTNVHAASMSVTGNTIVGTFAKSGERFDDGTYTWTLSTNAGPLSYGAPAFTVQVS